MFIMFEIRLLFGVAISFHIISVLCVSSQTLSSTVAQKCNILFL